MADQVLVAGDKAMFLPNFGAAVVVVQPGSLSGSGPATINGKKVCVDGDEGKLSVPGCSYMTPQYSIPGVGTLKIASLAGSQRAKKGKSGGKALLLKGGNFTAEFEVQTPAQQPPPAPPIPDAMPKYSGQGSFLSTNTRVRAT